jgi:hypothetical protein
MPWSRIFQKGEIKKINENAFSLKITWSWYGLMEFEESWVFNTLDEAKSKFLEIRGYGRLTALDENGTPVKL